MNKLSRYRKLRYNQLFESENRELRLNEMGNPLEVLSQYVDFEIFRPTLESALFTGERKSNAGRPPIDCVLMFKVLFLQRYYGLSDHQIEYQIVDRTSFRKFLGIECVDDVPDEKTVWKYRELLTNTGVYDKLFSEFHSFMESKGLQFNEGRIIDASFVIAPRQRNTRDENEQIKQGAGNKLWNDNPHKKCHKDVDARWTKKRDETFYGYKQHTKVEKRNKIILSYDTTSAEVHDSKVCRHNSPQQLRFQPDYLRVTTDVIHKTGECYIGFSTNKPYCTHHKSTHGLFLKPEYMLDKATCLGFFPIV